MSKWYVVAITVGLIQQVAWTSTPSYYAKYLDDQKGSRTLLSWGPGKVNPAVFSKNGLSETRVPRVIAGGPASQTAVAATELVEVVGTSAQAVLAELKARHVSGLSTVHSAPALASIDEVRVIHQEGPTRNRINLVFVGDGYILDEKEKFFADVKRLSGSIFNSNTLRSYTPVFNVYAVYRASEDSGLPIDKPRRTPYQTFRDGNTLRVINATDEGRLAVWDSCHQAPGCDYPILVANDPFYGGLGGEIAITTASVESGFKVLAHELGHTIGLVGEEYDGGWDFGANFSGDLDMLSWAQWLSGPLREEPVQSRITMWPWKLLSKVPYDIPFTSDGKETSAFLQVAGSGFREPGSLLILLDGLPIPQPFPGWPDGDRQFYDFTFQKGFTAGAHTLSFIANHPDPTTYLSSVTLDEYGSDFNSNPDNVGAYPMFSEHGDKVGYRPTNETCLMRNMNSKQYCPVCLENLWLKLFRKITVIDELEVTPIDDLYKLVVKTPHLGQIRDGQGVPGEALKIKWFFDGQEDQSFEDSFSLAVDKSYVTQKIEVEVSLISRQVRRDPVQLLTARRTWTVPTPNHQ